MSRQTLPLCQQRHDNVAVVRFRASGNHFEIACYRNKAQSYRNGVEKDVEEVLQIERVFTNVTHGRYAKMKNVRESFSGLIEDANAKNDVEFERAVCQYILEHGQMQLNEMERQAEQEQMVSDISTFIAERTVHPKTHRPYPVSMIRASLNQLGFAPNMRKKAKIQALEAIRKLRETGILELVRAQMRLQAVLTNGYLNTFLEEMQKLPGCSVVKTEKRDELTTVEFLSDPERYRELDRLVSKGGEECSLQVTSAAVTEEGECRLLDDSDSDSESDSGTVSRSESVGHKDKRDERRKRVNTKEDEQPPEPIVKAIEKDLAEVGETPETSDKKAEKKKRRNEEKKQERLERRRKEREALKAKEEEEELLVNAKKRHELEMKEKMREREEAALKNDPNYYDSEEENYDDFYDNPTAGFSDPESDEGEAKKKEKNEEEEEEEEEKKKKKKKLGCITKGKKKK